MKKGWIIGILVCIVLFLIACVPQSVQLKGTWEFIGYKAERVKSVIEVDSTICFDGDGNGLFYQSDDPSVSKSFTYLLSNDHKLAIIIDGNASVVEYSINPKTKRLTLDGLEYKLISSEADVFKKGEAEQPPKSTPIPTPTPTSTPTPILAPTPKEADTPKPTATPTPKETATPKPTATPTPKKTATPKPTATQMPSSFLFGGVEVQAGQSAVKVKGKKEALIRISPEEMDLLIKLCPNLSKLVLDYCCMADYSRIGELTGLKELEITTTTHEKDIGIPLTDIDWVSSLHRLRSLTLAYNEISDIRAIAELDELEELNLAWNKLEDNDLDWLSGMNLKKLYLYGNSYLKDVSALASIRSLQLLHLGGCRRITKIDKLSALKNLKELDISYCPLRDLTCFMDFKALKTLRIEKSEYVDFYYYYDLANCESLEKIVISNQDEEIEKALQNMIRDTGRYDIEIVYWEDYHEQ